MTLVTPKAGLTAGRSADIRVADTGGAAADAVARFGDRIAQVGARLEADRLDREASRAQIDMTRELGRARQEFEQMSDPDAIDRGWPERVNQLRAQLLDGQTEDGRPRVDPKIRDRVGLAFDDLATRYGLVLGRRAVTARQAQRRQNWGAMSEEVVSQAATADEDVRSALLDQAQAMISRDLEAGQIDRAEADKRSVALQDAVETAHMAAQVDGDIEPYSVDPPDPGVTVQARIADSPEGRRLARAMNYTPATPGDVARMQAALDQMETLPEGDRGGFIAKQAEIAGARRRAELPRPRYLAGAGITADGLRGAATRTVEAFRSGQIDRETYAREAQRIRDLMETFDGT